MTKVKTAELSSKALAWAVWMADRGEPGFPNPKTGYIWTALDENWAPHCDWSQAGPLIEKYRLRLVPCGAGYFSYTDEMTCEEVGETAIIAACRAIVAAKLGDEVDIPEELTK